MSAAGFFTKWILVPIGVGALGFFVFGPRFGGEVATKIKDAGVPIATPAEPSYPKPKVTVTARRIDGGISVPSSAFAPDGERKPQRRRRRHRTPKPEKPSVSSSGRTERPPQRDLPPVVSDDRPPTIDTGE